MENKIVLILPKFPYNLRSAYVWLKLGTEIFPVS